MNELDQIKMEALSLVDGETTKIYCPFCDNSKPWSPSLSITRTDGGIVYNCFRACCSGRGFIGSVGHFSEGTGEVNTFRPRTFQGSTSVLSRQLYEFIKNKYHLSDWEMKGQLAAAQINDTMYSGILISLKRVGGGEYGYTSKWFDKRDKAIHYLKEEYPLISFYKLQGISAYHTTVILTEDVISAVRCSKYRASAALLGTDLTEGKVKELLRNGYKDVILALDPDARDKAFKLRNKWGLFFNTFKVALLSKDPKDLTRDELEKELEL